MSWSVSAFGKPAAVKVVLASQFENAKKGVASIPEEQATVAAIETAVNAQLDFAAENRVSAIKVDASGSFYRKSGDSYSGGCQTKLEVQSWGTFLE